MYLGCHGGLGPHRVNYRPVFGLRIGRLAFTLFTDKKYTGLPDGGIHRASLFSSWQGYLDLYQRQKVLPQWHRISHSTLIERIQKALMIAAIRISVKNTSLGADKYLHMFELGIGFQYIIWSRRQL